MPFRPIEITMLSSGSLDESLYLIESNVKMKKPCALVCGAAAWYDTGIGLLEKTSRHLCLITINTAILALCRGIIGAFALFCE